MFTTLSRAGLALSAIALLAGFAAARSARADGPLDLSGLGPIGDLSGLYATATAQAAKASPPQSAMEAPAPAPMTNPAVTAPPPGPAAAPAAAVAPNANGSSAPVRLPSTGSHSANSPSMPVLAILLAIGGIACVAIARRTRIDVDRGEG